MKNKNLTNNNNDMNSQIQDLILKYNLQWELVGWYKDSAGKKEICRSSKETNVSKR